MAKWADIKPIYDEQNCFWVKVPKISDDYTEENKAKKYKGLETWDFLFEQFDKDQIFDLVAGNKEDETDKELVKNNINKFINNVKDWKNITVNDIIKNGNNEVLDFDKEALDRFIATNFWTAFVIVKEINDEVISRKNRIAKQKKT